MPEFVHSSTLTRRYEEALTYTLRLHADQARKVSGTPYIAHLLAVSSLVLEDGGDEDEAIAALLHDAIEDQGGQKTKEEIGERFGGRVSTIVEACSDAERIPKPPWRERKEAFIASLQSAPVSVQRVVAADKLHNVRSILRDYQRSGETIWQHFTGGREGTLWYYRSVTDVLIELDGTPLAQELDRVVTRLENTVRQA